MISRMWDYLTGWSIINKSMQKLFHCVELLNGLVADLRGRTNNINARLRHLEHILDPEYQPPPPPPEI